MLKEENEKLKGSILPLRIDLKEALRRLKGLYLYEIVSVHTGK